MKVPFPILNPLIRTGLERYQSEIETARFVSRQYNITLPELITELLRIAGEVKHG